MDLQTLCTVLQGCLSTDQATRTAAEAALKQHEVAPGQASNLLRVAAEQSVDAGVRHMASISFKNMVKRSWEARPEKEGVSNGTPPPSSGHFALPAEEKQLIRDNLLESLIRAPHQVQSQLAEGLKMVVYADYPEQWPGLLPALVANMMAAEPQRVHGALMALRITARKYEFRDEDERGPLAPLVEATFPPMLTIFQQLLSSPPTPEVCLYTKLVCKTFWSATYMGVPDHLLVPQQLTAWMNTLLVGVRLDMPEDQQARHLEDRPNSAWWKSRKWLFHILFRLVSRYSNPKHCKQGNDQAFATIFAKEFSITFLDCVLAKVAGLTQGVYSSPRVTNLIFQYLDSVINIKACYKHMAQHWDDILLNVAFPLMCFSDEDQRLWVEDPHEYIRKGYDILEDMYSPKTAVANFAVDLCRKERSHLDKFLGAMVGVLTQYHQAAAQGGGQVADVALVRRMDGALLAVGVLSEILEHKKPYKNQIGGMLVNFVLPLFSSPHGHLRAKAVWLAGVYAATPFPDGQGTGPSFFGLVEKAVGLLADPELPVRVDTVVALRLLIDTAEEVEPLKPLLPTLLNHIFNLMNQIDAEDLVFSLEALVNKFGQDIAPYAVEMVKQLAAAFDKYTADADEGDEDDDDTSGLAAYGCLRAMNTLLESVCGLGHELFPVLEPALLPLVYKLLCQDGHDVMEEVLELLGYLTFFGPGISPAMWALWPRMYGVLTEFGIDFWENFLVPLDNMISRDTATFVNSKDLDYLASAFQMVQYSLVGEFNDNEVVSAARLMGIILQVCKGQVDAWVAPYVALALQRLPRCESRKLRDELVLVVANAFHYNATLTLQALAASGALHGTFAAWFGMIMASKPTGKMQHFRRAFDKKVCSLGLLALLALPDEGLPPEVLSSRPLLLVGVTRVLAAHKQQELEQEEERKREEEEEEEDEDEDEEEDTMAADEEEGEEDGDEAGDQYLKRLEKQAKALMGLGGDDDGDDSDDDWTDDEEVQTPLDSVNPYVLLADTLARLSVQRPAVHTQLLAHVAQDPAGAQVALQALLQHAEAQRQADLNKLVQQA